MANRYYDIMTRAFYKNPSRETKLIRNAVNQHFGNDTPSLSNLEKTALQENGCIDFESSFWFYDKDE